MSAYVEYFSVQVRGAPAIAIVGCLSLAVEISKEEFEKKKTLRREVEGKLNYLISARPTAVNLKIAADELMSLVNALDKDDSISAAEMQSRSVVSTRLLICTRVILAYTRIFSFQIHLRNRRYVGERFSR